MATFVQLTWKTRNLRRLIKSLIWAVAMVFVAWLLGLQTTWQLVTLVVAALIIDNALDDWLPTSSDDNEHAQALIAAEQAGYQRGLSEMKLRSYSTGKPA